MGNPVYTIDSGKIIVDGEDVTEAETDERAREGLFLGFQYPSEISGISTAEFLREAINAKREEKGGDPIKQSDFKKRMEDALDMLDMDDEYARRYLNDGFSGGEKKRNEILQLAVLQGGAKICNFSMKYDSGLDIDALQISRKWDQRSC
ncbi:FeS assembly ATPase SufC [Candidatus Haloredivivus sp. G17]|nr:FeS assembly ATPase SufC [Candidatus Haloredivivus sp. G17]